MSPVFVRRCILPLCAAFSLYGNFRLAKFFPPTTRNDTIISKWADLGQPKSLWHQKFFHAAQDDGHNALMSNDAESDDSNLGSNSYDPCDVLPGQGEEGNAGFQALYQVNIPEEVPSNATAKILCVLYNATSQDSIKAAYEVYGSRCDNFLATTTTNINVENIESKQILSSNATEWENLLRILKRVHDYDVLHISTERTFVVVENLRRLLPSIDEIKEKGMYLGGPALVTNKPKRRYCSPGSGYSLNKKAVKKVLKCHPKMNIMNPHERLADCLRRKKIICENTMDRQRLRYLEYGADFAATWRKSDPGPIPFKKLDVFHQMKLDVLMFGISSSLVGIHMVHGELPINTTTSNANLLRRFNAVARKTCEKQWSQILPHGALDENDNPDYIHDPTYIQRNPLSLNLVPEHDSSTCEREIGDGIEGVEGGKGLQKIRVQKVSSTSPRLMCAVYTHSGSHKQRIEAIAETYGQRCDGFMAASNLTDRRIGAVNLLHEGPETYGNMWLKVRAMWTYIYEHYLNDFDFFHIGGDDMYLIPENLKRFVSDSKWNQSSPLYLGTAIADLRSPQYYCGGGAGYTLNRAALRLLVEELFSTSACSPHFTTSQEDRKIGDCFRSVGIRCLNTQDELGEER